MRVDRILHRLLTLFLVAGLSLCVITAPGEAGEVSGKVAHGVFRAHVGGMPGSLPGSDAIGRSTTPVGPVLIYVGEASSELPLRETAPVRLRITAGGLNPTLQAICVGSTLEFENADATAHRLTGRSSHGSFDFGWQPGGTTRARKITQVGVIRLRCELEDRELGELVVLPHTCFAVTDAGGSYRLMDLPAGPATIVAYSATLGEVSRRVTIPAAGGAEVDLTF